MEGTLPGLREDGGEGEQRKKPRGVGCSFKAERDPETLS